MLYGLIPFVRLPALALGVNAVLLGGLAACYAATDKAARLLHWHAEKDLADMCRDAWRWQQSQNQ